MTGSPSMNAPSSSSARSPRGSIVTLAVGVLSAGAIVGVIITSFTGGGDKSPIAGSVIASNIPKVSKPKLARRATAAELKVGLARVGISPSLLASSGASGNDAAGVVANARQYLTEHPDELTALDIAFGTAQSDVDRLESLIQRGQGTELDMTALATARQSWTSIFAARDAAVTGLRTAAFASLTTEKRNLALNILANRSWRLPQRYLTLTHTDQDWMTLRDAYANAQACARTGDAPDETLHQALTDADAASATPAANLAANLATVRTAFDNAISGE